MKEKIRALLRRFGCYTSADVIAEYLKEDLKLVRRHLSEMASKGELDRILVKLNKFSKEYVYKLRD